MKKGETGKAVYLKFSWWWVVQSGNRTLHFGPYKSEAEANTRRDLGPKGQSLM